MTGRRNVTEFTENRDVTEYANFLLRKMGIKNEPSGYLGWLGAQDDYHVTSKSSGLPEVGLSYGLSKKCQNGFWICYW